MGSQTPSGFSQPSTGAGTGSGTTPQSQPPQAGPSTSNALLQLSKRRRGLGVVTPNACTECRKKRAKVRIQARFLSYISRFCPDMICLSLMLESTAVGKDESSRC